jgi:2-desacetyl-2-hydroxyethyl bacteriochlorophyllide A dehydrogenase
MSGDVMRAAVLHGPGDLRVEQRPVPAPAPGEVLVEVGHCGVCGTDLHMVIEGWGRPGSIGGHEWSGRVVGVGAGVDGLTVGDLVVGGAVPGCGSCAGCRARRPSLCDRRGTPGASVSTDGAFAELVRADARSVVPVPDGLDPRTAALAEPLAVALHALTLAGVRPTDRVLVSGAGPIGALAVAALRSRGVEHVVVSEPGAPRQRLAARLGATRVVDPEELEVPSIAEPRRVVDGAVDVVLECSGRARAMEACLAQLDRAGRLVLVGTGIEPPRFDPNRIILNELVVTGAYEYDDGGIGEAIDLLASGLLHVEGVAEIDDVPLEGLLDAMVGLAGGTIAGKVLVNPRLRS